MGRQATKTARIREDLSSKYRQFHIIWTLLWAEKYYNTVDQFSELRNTTTACRSHFQTQLIFKYVIFSKTRHAIISRLSLICIWFHFAYIILTVLYATLELSLLFLLRNQSNFRNQFPISTMVILPCAIRAYLPKTPNIWNGTFYLWYFC